MKTPTQHVIDEKLLNELINYLARRPYAEVFRMIATLGQLEEVKGCKSNGKCGDDLALPRRPMKKKAD